MYINVYADMWAILFANFKPVKWMYDKMNVKLNDGSTYFEKNFTVKEFQDWKFKTRKYFEINSSCIVTLVDRGVN